MRTAIALIGLVVLSLMPAYSATSTAPVVIAQTSTLPGIKLNIPAELTLYQSDFKDGHSYQVSSAATDSVGLQCLSLSTGWGGGSMRGSATKVMMAGAGFYAGSYFAGDYPITAVTINTRGKSVMVKSIIHVVAVKPASVSK